MHPAVVLLSVAVVACRRQTLVGCPSVATTAMELAALPLATTPMILPCSRASFPAFVLHPDRTPTRHRLGLVVLAELSLAAVPAAVPTGAQASVGLLSSSLVVSGRLSRRSPSAVSVVASSSSLLINFSKGWEEEIRGDHLVSMVALSVEIKRPSNNSSSNSSARTYGRSCHFCKASVEN